MKGVLRSRRSVITDLFDILSPQRFPQVAAQTTLPGRPGVRTPIPSGLHPQLVETLTAQGVEELWSHQAGAWEAARRREHFIVTTGTASGKSLCFNLPVVDSLLRDAAGRALYLYPTKALAQDQIRRLKVLAGPRIELATYDGDTPAEARYFARERGRILLTNPDMINVSILPRHERWGDFLFNLKYVVIDEAHTYRGVFGSHVANVLRRLRRVASFYGADPQFILASATIRNAAAHAEGLTGLSTTVISGDGAPTGQRRIVFWQPPVIEDRLNLRRSAIAEAAEVLAELVRGGARSICFTKSRRSAEVIHQMVVDILKRESPSLAERVSPYRAGYTPEQRRAIERLLFSGELLAVVSTNALELGIDIGALDAAVTVGYPGTVASLWQQWGRAGRGRGRSVGVFVAGNDALEQFFIRHPDELLAREVEAAAIDFANPHIHGPHLEAAAYEAALAREDEEFFGPGLEAAADRCAERGRLRRTADTWFYTGPDFPAAKIGLRSTTAEQYTIVEQESGAIVGTEGAETALSALHPGAVYLHLGESFLVESLDLDKRIALVRPFFDTYYTQARRETSTEILGEELSMRHGPVALHLGTIEVSSQVVAFQKKRAGTDEAMGTEELDLPAQRFVTEGLWITLPLELLPDERLLPRLPGALHAVEHALIALLPLLAMCDRWDIGGLSTPVHHQTELPTIFVYDGHAGGVGIARVGVSLFQDWLRDARALIRDCPCDTGCPSCIQSPKCGNLNEPLDKELALLLLGAMLD